jgi:excisionase family DNA binding protein
VATAAAWPWPGDSPLAIARKVANAYRARLHSVDPALCEQTDDLMRSFGQKWAVPNLITTPDDAVLTAAQAAEYLGISMAAIRRLRLAGRLKGYQDGRVWVYEVLELRRLMTAPRPRRRAS